MKLGVTEAYPQVMYGSEPNIGQLCKYIRWAKEIGVKSVELTAITEEHLYRDFTQRNDIDQLLSCCELCDLEIVAFEAFFCKDMLTNPNEGIMRKLAEHFEKSVAVTKDMGAKIIYTLSSAPPEWHLTFDTKVYGTAPPTEVRVLPDFSWRRSWNSYVERIRTLTRIAESEDLNFGLEIRPYEIVSSSNAMLTLIQEVDSDSFGVIFDTAHFFVQKEILPVAVEKLNGSILLVHLADNDGCVDSHLPPGKGKIDWKSFLAALRKIGYDGSINLDIHGTPENISDEYLYGKHYIEKILNRI